MSSKTKRKFCNHCEQMLSLPVYKRHKADFYDEKKDLWITSAMAPVYDPSIDAEDDYIISTSMLDFRFVCFILIHKWSLFSSVVIQ